MSLYLAEHYSSNNMRPCHAPLPDALLARTALRTLHPGGGGEGPGHVHLRGQERGGQVTRSRLPPGQQCYQHEDLKVS